MKNEKRFHTGPAVAAFAAILLAAGSVSCESVLDKEPVLETTASNIFSDKSKIELNLKGIYVRAENIIGKSLYLNTDVRGDDFINILQNNEAIPYEMGVTATTPTNSTVWNSLYLTVNEVNIFLENLAEASEAAGDDYGKFAAEARFVRALCYYYLNTLYAAPYKLSPDGLSVPLRLKGESSTENNDLAQSTVAEVFEQILDDLSEENLAALPDGVAATYDGVTRASRAAARMLRQRVYLECEEWSAAVAEGLAIEGYSLAADVSQPFTAPYYTSENIFSFPFGESNRATLASNYYAGTSYVIDYYCGIVSYPLYSQPADARISAFIGERASQHILLKFPDYTTGLDWTPVFRYAETLLNMAEAYWNLGDESRAAALLMQVRRRSIAAEDDALREADLTGDTLRDAIYNERRLEFLGEALRSLDIHRRAETYVKQKGTSAQIVCGPNDFGYIWPIPATEIEHNNLIK